MAIAKNQVFLVQGQTLTNGGQRLEETIEQIVVVAGDTEAMMAAIAQHAPDFRPVGWATLEAYEAAAAKLRAALKGEVTGWPLLVAPGMVE